MKSLNKELLKELLNFDEKLCLSLYMPTHRSHPDNLQDPIRFKSLVKKLEESLALKYSNKEIEELLQPFVDLQNDLEFWKHTLDGIAIFSSNNYFETVNLHMPVKELAIAADSFHTKPIRQYLQTTDHFFVLGLSLHEIKLFEGSRHDLTEISLHDNVAKTIQEALGDELTEKHTTVASYGGVGGESSNMHHGHGSKKDEVGIDAERFFRVVASDIYEHYSKSSEWPLILAALPEHHSLFKKVNKNPFLLEDGIAINANAVSTDVLKNMAWEIIEPQYNSRLEKLAARFNEALAHGKGSDSIKEAAIAATEGRIEILLLEADKIIEGRITNLITGNIQKKDINNPRIDDLLDDMGELVTKMGGEVIIMPKDKIPSYTGVAAIYRY